MPDRALLAPDSFKGSMTSAEVAAAMAEGVRQAGWLADEMPLADGGEGTAAAMSAASGSPAIEMPEPAHDPLGRTVPARWWNLGGGRALVEVAEASGLGRVSAEERDPVWASTYGTGELIAAAAAEANEVLVAAGGSATTDGGAGAILAIERGGLGSASVRCICDVATPWEEAAELFAPQKGATEADVKALEERLGKLAAALPRDPRGVPATGAAGGLTGGLWARFGADLVPGAKFVCDALGADARIEQADLVFGGEGALDATTVEGKALAEVGMRCADQGRPMVAIVGRDDSTPAIREAIGVAEVVVAGDAGSVAEAAREIAVRYSGA